METDKQCSSLLNVTVLEMECLATWRNANHHFAFGYFIGDAYGVKENAYRCFVSIIRCATIFVCVFL